MPINAPEMCKISRFAMLAAIVTQSNFALACVGCGQSQSFTPKILLVGSGFVILPLSFAAVIGWRLWKDHQYNKNK